MIMGMEAKTRSEFERIIASPRVNPDLPTFWTCERVEVGGLVFMVSYHPERSWAYDFSSPASNGPEALCLRGSFDSRDSCLQALVKHMVTA